MRWTKIRGLAAHRGGFARVTKGATSTLVAAALVAGCNGGGGGGSPATTPAAVPAPVMGAIPVEAKAPPATNEVSLAAGLLFPLYPLAANGVQQGTRIESPQGDITLSYRESARDNAILFRSTVDIFRDPEFLLAARGTTTYGELFADAASGLSLIHSRFGYITYVDPATGQRTASPFYFGYETPVTAPGGGIPLTGYAEYTGKVLGFLGGTTVPNVDGDIRLRTYFDTSRVFGTVSNLTQDDGSGNETALGITANLQTGGQPGAPLRRDVGQAHYQGNWVGTRTVGGSSTAVNGTIDGRFFGWDGKETAGNIRLSWSNQTILGSYGANSSGGFLDGPLNPPEVFATAISNDIRDATDLSFPLKSNVGPVPSGSRTFGADGKLTVVYQSSEGKSVAVFLPQNITRLSDGTLRAEQDGRIYTETLRVDNTNGDLQYSRFGALQFTDSGDRADRPFAFGYATPVTSIPTTGFADYYGSTSGVYKSGTVSEDLSGLINLRADFAQRAVSGRISAIEITNAAGEIRRPGLLFDVATSAGGRIADGKFSGAVSGSGVGAILGQFYGPNYDEVSGTWSANLDANTSISAAFGTRTATNTHPSGAPGVPPWQSFISPRPVNEPYSVRFIRADSGLVSADPPPFVIGSTTIRPLADGGFDIVTSVGGDSRQTTFNASELTPIDPTKTGIQRMVRGDENGLRATIGGTAALSYTRFGYWEDVTEVPRVSIASFFHAGSPTPAANVPTSGSATYQGATIGQALAGGVLTQIQGQMNMTADFTARSVTGSLFGFTAANSAGTAVSSPISTVNMSGSYAFGATRILGTTQSAIAGQSSPSTGTFEGQFYGRNAEEIGGAWSLGAQGENVRAWGAFGGSR